jgi:hypothetical protein
MTVAPLELLRKAPTYQGLTPLAIYGRSVGATDYFGRCASQLIDPQYTMWRHLLKIRHVDDFGRIGGKKPFSRQMIRKLAAYFGVDVTVVAGNL